MRTLVDTVLKHPSATNASANTSPSTVNNVAERHDGICDAASNTVNIVVVHHDNAGTSMGDASPSNRPAWRIASGWVTGKATPSWTRDSRGS